MVNVNSEAKLDIIRGTFEWGESNTLPMQFKVPGLPEDQEFSIEGESIVPNTEDGSEIGYMMLRPELSEYKMQLTIIPPKENVAQQPQAQTWTLTIKQADGTPFEAGKSYTVNIALYAMQEVKVEATLSKWVNAGDEITLPVE